MDDLKRMAVFAAVVQHGSMSGAARALGMSTSAVSQQVRKLESDGGVTLLHRSTRKLALTDAGQRYHAGCAAMCAAAEQARAELAASRDAPSGELRLSATVGFARHVAPALGALLAEHPALRLRLLVDDAPIDLINTRIDLAVRFGRLQDSLGDKLILDNVTMSFFPDLGSPAPGRHAAVAVRSPRLGGRAWPAAAPGRAAVAQLAGFGTRGQRAGGQSAQPHRRTTGAARGATHCQQQPVVDPADVRGWPGPGADGQHGRARGAAGRPAGLVRQ